MSGPRASDMDTVGGVGTEPGSMGGGSTTLASGVSAGTQHEAVSVAPGQELGQFVVVRFLGRGAMGVVALAHDRELDRPVAIKLLLAAGSEVARARLLREAQSAARLSHPNVVAVHQVSTFQGQVYLVMEHVDGGTLRDFARAGARGWPEILDAYVQAGRGLAAAHAAGFVHRDFKPDNVLIGRDGRVRVTDFGLVAPVASVAATSHGAAHPLGGEAESLDPASRLTHSGAVLGTPAYMAPEQFGLGEVDPRADQFSYCVSLFEALFGRRPFEGATAANLYLAIEAGRMVDVPRGEVPGTVYAAIVRGLQFDPQKRWPSMDSLLDALAIRPARVGPSPAVVGLAVGGTVALLGAASLAYWLMRSPDGDAVCADPRSQLASIWNEDAREDLQTALRRSERTDAEAISSLVEARIDSFVETWTGMHEAACQATRVRKELPEATLALRHACLTRSAIELEAIVDLLVESEEKRVLAAAPGVLDVVTPLGRCGDIEALRREGVDAEPSASEREVLRTVVRAAALLKAGFEQKAEALLDDAIIQAQPIENARLLGRAHTGRVESRFMMSDAAGAMAAAEQAIDATARAKAYDVEAAARVMMLYVASHDPAFADRSDALVAAAREATGRAKDDLAVARMHACTASAYLQAGRTAEAETDLARALGFYEDLEDRVWAERSATRALRAQLFLQQQRPDDAMVEAERALEIAAKGLGPEHPYVGNALVTRAMAEGASGASNRASATLLEARGLWLQAYGSDYRALASIDVQLAGLAFAEGQLDAALEHHGRALAQIDRLEPEPGEQRAILLDQKARMLMHAGRHTEAASTWEAALSIYARTVGEDHPRAVAAASALERTRAELARLDVAG